MTNLTNDRWIERFQREVVPVIREKYNPVRILLFGSRVTGTASEESDIDVILVSSKFEGKPFFRRATPIRVATLFPKAVDYLCYTPEEYERIQRASIVVHDAAQHAVELTP
ncbi:MAG: nucleotidyltransferase domain-containing protein [Candidatus Poribacteria bacterium]|nr:nucleotidyltransferase domain-containing protein [Candidatus Poribacteria bacterium]